MVSEKKVSRGYGARYGPKVRGKFSKISKEQRQKYNCPYCGYKQAKRLSVGIWHCSKCNSKFTNKAYRVGKLEPIKKKILDEEEENE